MNNLAIIILNWNNKELTNVCIDSIKRQTYREYDIFVVDNDSDDDSISFLEKKHNDIKIIKNDSNLGYAAGNNIGIKEAVNLGYKYVFILNNDVELLPNVIGPLIYILEKNDKMGVVSPIALNYYEDKKDAKECNLYGDYNFLFGVFNSCKIERNKLNQVEIAIGCALLFKSEVFEKCGFFDERFYMYFEENDLLKSVVDNGYLVSVYPDTRVYHREGSSSRFSKFPKNYYMIRNQLLFHKKHSKLVVFIFFLVYFFVKLPIFLFRWKNIKDLRMHLLGLKDFFIGKYYRTEITRNAEKFIY